MNHKSDAHGTVTRSVGFTWSFGGMIFKNIKEFKGASSSEIKGQIKAYIDTNAGKGWRFVEEWTPGQQTYLD